jgi:hypothetical protein
MPREELFLVVTAFLLTSSLARADFRFTQSGQVTGTSVARGATHPFVTTTYVKGARLRIDLPDGSYGIIDLDRRLDIQVDPKSRTYFSISFDAIRAGDGAYEQQVGRLGFHPRASGAKALPEMKATGRTQVLLGQPTRELALRLVRITRPGRYPPQRRSIEIESWVAASVSGFAEVRDFYVKLAGMMAWAPVPAGTQKGFVEVTWAALTATGPPGMSLEPAVSVPLMTKGILDLSGTAEETAQLPMVLSYRSTMAAAQDQGADEGQSEAQITPQGPAPQHSSGGGSSPSELDVRTVSYSAERLDPSLFQVPAGYALADSGIRRNWITTLGRNGVLVPFGM